MRHTTTGQRHETAFGCIVNFLEIVALKRYLLYTFIHLDVVRQHAFAQVSVGVLDFNLNDGAMVKVFNCLNNGKALMLHNFVARP